MVYTGIMTASDASDVRDRLINPYYAVTFADYLFINNGTALAKEDWVLANAKLIHENGANGWLEQLLKNLIAEPTEDLTHMVMNPRQAVVFSNSLQGLHVPLIDKPTWLIANSKLMGEIGTEEWLWRLLSVLETDKIAS